MRTAIAMLAAVAAISLPGCLSSGDRSDDRRAEPRAPEVVHHRYVYFPSQHAYWCSTCDDWWVNRSGEWNRTRARPTFIVISDDTAWVELDGGDPDPSLNYQEHARTWPSDWKPDHGKGPPPGRGWRK